MIKAILTEAPKSVLLGLSYENIHRLQQDQPIEFASEDLGLTEGAFFITTGFSSAVIEAIEKDKPTHLALTPAQIGDLMDGKLLEFALTELGGTDLCTVFVLAAKSEEAIMSDFKAAGMVSDETLVHGDFSISKPVAVDIGRIEKRHVENLAMVLAGPVGIVVTLSVLVAIGNVTMSLAVGGFFVVIVMALFDKSYERVTFLEFGEHGFRLFRDGKATSIRWDGIVLIDVHKEGAEIVDLTARSKTGEAIVLTPDFHGWPEVVARFRARSKLEF